MTKYDLNNIRDLVRKAALLFHDPQDLARVEDLTQEEVASLRDEGVRELQKILVPAKPATAMFCYLATSL